MEHGFRRRVPRYLFNERAGQRRRNPIMMIIRGRKKKEIHMFCTWFVVRHWKSAKGHSKHSCGLGEMTMLCEMKCNVFDAAAPGATLGRFTNYLGQ